MTTNIEALPLKKFIETLKKLSDFIVSAQTIGDFFFFGLDTSGNLYSSPYSPDNHTKFFYDSDSYPKEADCNLPRMAHAFLLKNNKSISQILAPGQAVKCQLISEEATTTGLGKPNCISILRGVKGEAASPSADQISKLVDACSGKKSVRVKTLSTVDGEQVFFKPEQSDWDIKFAARMGGKHLTSSELDGQLKKLEKFLELRNKEVIDLGLSNYSVLTVNLIKVDEKFRDRVKAEREALNNKILVKFKLPIKKIILDTLENELSVKSAILHNKSDEIAVTNDSEVTDVARFDSIAKRQISGFQRTNDSDASVEDRGGILGVLEQRIAELLGVPELSKTQSAMKLFKDVKSSSPEKTAAKFAESLQELDFNGVKGKIVAILGFGLKQLAEKLEDFKREAGSVKMVTADNKTLTYSPEVIKQNLVEFAELKAKLKSQQKQINTSTNFAELVFILYSDDIEAAHGQSLSEAQLVEGIVSLTDLIKMSAEDICHAYTSTLLSSQLLIRNEDVASYRLLRDHTYSTLKYYSLSMSPLNFWGFVLFNPTARELKPYLSAHVISKLQKLTKPLMRQNIRRIHDKLSSGKKENNDWIFQLENSKLFTLKLNTRSQSINMIIAGIEHWDEITLANKNTIITKLFYYLQRFVPNSILLSRIRNLSTLTLTMANTKKFLDAVPVTDFTESLLGQLSDLAEDLMNSTTLANSVSTSGHFGPSDAGDPVGPDSDGAATKKAANRDLRHTTKMVNGRYVILKARTFKKADKFSPPTPITPTDGIMEDEGGAEGTSGDTAGMTTSSAIAAFPTPLFKAKKKKKMIKRLIPGYTTPVSESASIVLEWTDVEYSGNASTDAGFTELRQRRIEAEVIQPIGENGWPIVKLTGSKQLIEQFLTNEYGASPEFINSNLKTN